MAENDLNNLSQGTAPTPLPVTVEATGPVTTEKVVDTTPDPASLKAEIDQLETRRKKAEEDAIYWRKQKAEARADYFRGREGGEIKPPQEPAPQGVGPDPKPSDFPDYDQYVDAKTKFEVKRARAEWERDSERKANEQSQRERSENLQTKLQEGFQKYTDFEEVAFDRTATHITPMVVDILADCDHPADVAYYLAKNRVEGVAIARMTPLKAARAIALLEAKLANNAPPPASPPPQRKTTNAPPPINPLGGGTGGIEKDPEKMTNKEYEQWRISQGAKRF
jgi:hypothetical protein